MLAEFKKFAFKGNLMDMAVGIIIGGAFGTVVKSLVDDVFMPVIGYFTGGIDFSDKFWTMKVAEEAAKEAGATVMPYGNFATATVSFLIIAFVLFLLIKKFIAAFDKEEEKPAEEAKVPEDVALLTEIRDLLKDQKN
ncbi:UNVERIFIED_CONTAM: hypothetical protein GTU68_046157 [Idotea baltica]|nr:hypothetical protein [Idotea baltica]